MQRLVERLPRWAVAVIAVACIVIGVVLTLRPFTSIEVLVLLVGVGAVVTGVLTVLHESPSWAHRWLVGVGWIVLGGVVLVWPGLSVGALAVAVGIGLIAHGLVDLFAVVTGRVRVERAAMVLGGLVACIFGLLALSWPDVTVLVVAVLFGARTVLFGASQLASLFSHRSDTTDGQPAPPRSRVRRVMAVVGRAAALVVALGLLAVSVRLHDDGRTVSAFYETPDEIPETPGVLIRSEPFTDGIPDNAEGWLIMYSTQSSLGQPTVATAVVMAPKQPSSVPRPLVAWTHGTVGVARACAPSLSGDPFGDLPAIPELLDNGWVMVATDYAGMGTEGVSPYLIGTGQAYSTLDSIRAAHQMSELNLSEHTVVWGHSQGGHAALWTGILAGSYAPELTIDGVAAMSPATNVATMASVVQGQPAGSLGSAYVISSYAGTYDDVDFDEYVRPGAAVQVREAAQRCLSDPALVISIITSLPATQSVFALDPTTGPLGLRLEQNTPTGTITAPLLVAQGTADEVIPIGITDDWVAERCAAGQHMEYVRYPDRTHMSVLLPDSPLTDKLATWTADRFDGEPATPTC